MNMQQQRHSAMAPPRPDSPHMMGADVFGSQMSGTSTPKSAGMATPMSAAPGMPSSYDYSGHEVGSKFKQVC